MSGPPAQASDPDRESPHQDHLDDGQGGFGVAAAVEAVDHNPKRESDQEGDQGDTGNQPDPKRPAAGDGRLLAAPG
jgi:hypothetical protein